MKFTTTDNIKIAYTEAGEGQPMLMLHGFGANKEIWTSQLNAFKDDHHMIAMDLRNHGESERTIKGQWMGRFAADVAELIERLDLHDVILMGHSMGAAVGWAYLSMFGEDRIACMIDMDQSPKMLSDDTWHYGFKDYGWERYPEAFIHGIGKTNVLNFTDETYLASKAINVSHPFNVEKNEGIMRDHVIKDWRPVVADLHIPLLIIAGGSSPIFNADFAEATVAFTKHGQSMVIPGVGHVVMAEQPKLVNNAILKFFADCQS